MKKTMKKIVALGSGAALLVSASVMGTMAYLTSTTDVVENTFTVGKVVITLDEAQVDEDGIAIAGDRVQKNEYQLFPNHKYDKDPTVHVDKDSEDCWLFVKVTNDIAAIESDDEDNKTVAEQMEDNGWTLVDGETNVYAYKEVVNANDNIVVFKNFKIDSDVDNDKLAEYAGKTITVTAYAVQEDGFDTAAGAWKDAPTDWTK